MKVEWSPSWKHSAQTRKQRKYVYNAPMHARQKLVHAHLSKELRKKFGKRAVQLRKGDEVKIMRGSKFGIKAKVSEVDLKRIRVYLEGQMRETTKGKKIPISFHPSKLLITNLEMNDKRRFAASKTAPKAVQQVKK